MSTALSLPLMTVEQYWELPDPEGPYVWELHFGELIKLGRPKKLHYRLQRLIRDLLIEKRGQRRLAIDIEMPYGLTLGNDYRACDVRVVLRKTFEADPAADCLIGSPHLVIQVKSRSKREEDAVLYIPHGASALWLVKPERREVVVVTASSRQVHLGGEIFAI